MSDTELRSEQIIFFQEPLTNSYIILHSIIFSELFYLWFLSTAWRTKRLYAETQNSNIRFQRILEYGTKSRFREQIIRNGSRIRNEKADLACRRIGWSGRRFEWVFGVVGDGLTERNWGGILLFRHYFDLADLSWGNDERRGDETRIAWSRKIGRSLLERWSVVYQIASLLKLGFEAKNLNLISFFILKKGHAILVRSTYLAPWWYLTIWVEKKFVYFMETAIYTFNQYNLINFHFVSLILLTRRKWMNISNSSFLDQSFAWHLVRK